MKKYALLSVFDKTNIIELAKNLISKNYNLLSRELLNYLEIMILMYHVSSFTNFPEILEGRVKTLHPNIFGSILQKDINTPDSVKHNLVDLDIVCVNLYPFEECLKSDSEDKDKLIENIDIGGVSLLRAAAKNHKRVYALSSPGQYEEFIFNFENSGLTPEYSQKLALEAFKSTCNYDSKISQWLSGDNYIVRHYNKNEKLKYGCNPHQKPSYVYENIENNNIFEVLNGTPGYINYLDAWGCWNLVNDIWFSIKEVCACSFKHTSPAGVLSR